MFNAYLLKIGFVRLGSFTIGVADRISRKFAFSANAANFTHIFILRLELLLFNTEYFTIKDNKKQLFLIAFSKIFKLKALKNNFF